MKSFYSKELENLSPILLDFLKDNRVNSAIDLGCGAGDLAYALSHHNLLPAHYVGVDKKPQSCRYIKKYVPSVDVICIDAQEAVGSINETFDLIISEQVIEHIEDDGSFLRKIHGLMHKGSKLYISSIIRKKYAWWFYRYKGEVRFCPEHIREYGSESDFLQLLERSGFKAIKVRIKRIPFFLFHWIDRLLVKLRLINEERLKRWYDRFSLLRFLRKRIIFSVFGFYAIEVLAEEM